jgi:chromosome segregation ATPase
MSGQDLSSLQEVIRERNVEIQSLQNQKVSLNKKIEDITKELKDAKALLDIQGNSSAMQQQVDMLQARLREYTSTNDGLKIKINGLVSLNTTLEKRAASLQKALGNAQQTIRTLAEQRKNLKQLYDQKVTEYGDTAKIIENLKAAKDQQASTFEKERQDLLKEIQRIKNLYAEATESQKKTEAQLQVVTSERDAALKQNAKLTSTVSGLEQQLQTKAAEYQKTLAALKKAQAEEADAIAGQNSAALEKALADKERLQKELDLLQSEYGTTNDVVKSLKQQLTSERRAKDELEQLLTDAKQNMTSLRDQYTDKISTLEAAKQKVIEAMRVENAAALALAQKEKESVEKELNSLQVQYSTVSTQVGALQDELKAERGAKDILEQELAKVQASMTGLRDQYTQRMKDLEEAKQLELAAIESKNKAALEAARAKRVVLEKELDAVNDKYKAAVTLTEELKVSLAAETEAKEEAIAQLNDLKGALTNLSDQYAAKILEIQEARQKQRIALDKGKMSEVEYLKQVVTSLQNEISLMQGQYDVAQQRIKTLENQLKLANQERDTARAQSLRVREQLEQFREEYDRKILALKTSQAKERVALEEKNKAAIAAEKATQNALRVEIAALQSQHEVASRQIESLQVELKTERDLNEELAAQLESLQNKITKIREDHTAAMEAYKKARQKEIDALNAKNMAAAARAKAEKEDLQATISALEGRYDVAVTQIQTIEGELGVERTLNDELSTQLQSEQDRNALLTSQLNKATATPTPTTPVPDTGGWGSTVYVIVHAPTWLRRGILHVVTLTSGGVTLQQYRGRDYAQTFAISNSGTTFRSVAADGLYLSDEGCSTPIPNDVATGEWKVERAGSHYLERAIRSMACGKYLGSPLSQQIGFVDMPESWYIVPVGQRS